MNWISFPYLSTDDLMQVFLRFLNSLVWLYVLLISRIFEGGGWAIPNQKLEESKGKFVKSEEVSVLFYYYYFFNWQLIALGTRIDYPNWQIVQPLIYS